jgi:hypothetical protein
MKGPPVSAAAGGGHWTSRTGLFLAVPSVEEDWIGPSGQSLPN